MELLRATSGEGSQDTQMERSAQLSCSVKEEPDADGQEMGESGSPTRSGVLPEGMSMSQDGMRAQEGLQTAELGPQEAGGKDWRTACLPCDWHTQ